MRSNPVGNVRLPAARDDRSIERARNLGGAGRARNAPQQLSKRHRRLRGSTYNKRIGRWTYRE
jgi:hypothetical protein